MREMQVCICLLLNYILCWSALIKLADYKHVLVDEWPVFLWFKLSYMYELASLFIVFLLSFVIVSLELATVMYFRSL